jgi:hypothetical protein
MSVRLAIGWLNSHGYPISGQVFDCYERLQQHVASGAANAALPDDLQIVAFNRINATSFPVDYDRNEVCREFLKGDATHLLFLDLDHLYKPDLAERLLRARKPVITARYHMRREPFHAAAYVKHRMLDGPHVYAPVHFGQGVFEIERAGAGALLIERRVIETIQTRQRQHWFDLFASPAYAQLSAWGKRFLPPAPTVQWFRYQHGPTAPHDMSVSEDFWFFQEVREAGFTCWCDWDTEAQHLQPFAIDGSWNRSALQEQIARLGSLDPEQRQQIVDHFVACGYPDGLTLSSGDHIAPYTYTPGER